MRFSSSLLKSFRLFNESFTWNPAKRFTSNREHISYSDDLKIKGWRTGAIFVQLLEVVADVSRFIDETEAQFILDIPFV